MNENIKELIESLPDEGVDCKGNKWTRIERYGKMLNFEGQRFTRLLALFPVKIEKDTKPRWLCLCDCSNYVCVDATKLRRGNTRSCGCLQKDTVSHRYDKQREEFIGTKHGRLTAIKFVGVENQASMYLFRCDCGKEIVCSAHSVKIGNTTSCGCKRKDMQADSINSFIGRQFGKLHVDSFAGMNKHHGSTFWCTCSCGNRIIVSRNCLQRGQQSCGCLRSTGENNIEKILKEGNIPFKKQVNPPGLVSEFGGYPTYDFAILNEQEEIIRLIEFDGNQHIRPYDYFGGEEKFEKVKKNDSLKNEYALFHNIPLVRIPYSKRDSMTLDDLLSDKYTITKQ